MMPTINTEHNNLSSLSSYIGTTDEAVIVNATLHVCFIDFPNFNTDYKLHHCGFLYMLRVFFKLHGLSFRYAL